MTTFIYIAIDSDCIVSKTVRQHRIVHRAKYIPCIGLERMSRPKKVDGIRLNFTPVCYGSDAMELPEESESEPFRVNPFDNVNLVITHFDAAVYLLRQAMKIASKVTWVGHIIRPLVLIHPLMARNRKTLEVEDRLLTDAVLTAATPPPNTRYYEKADLLKLLSY
jgi:hypothetical protein